jgi:hypothetical protein
VTTENTFFIESQDLSKVKSEIVTKYFDVWANVIISAQNKRLNKKKRNYNVLNALMDEVKPGEIVVFDWENMCIFGELFA